MMPKSRKEMQSFLGTVIFMQQFTPDFAKIAAPLYESTAHAFDWEDKKLVEGLKMPFDAMKIALSKCMNLYYPDYELQWFLRSDASVFVSED